MAPVPGREDQWTCERDGASTRLSCVECRTPICPQCLVRTPVGMKCDACGARPGPAAAGRGRAGGGGGGGRRRSRWVVVAPVAAVAAAVAAAVLVPRLRSSDGFDRRVETYNPAAENRPAAPYTFGGIGREVVDQNLSFVVKSVECGPTEVAGRAAQGRFCLVTLTVRNVSRTSVTLDSSTQTLSDGAGGAGRRFQADPGATAAHPANAGLDMLAPVVNPGNELTGVLVYDLPADAKPVSLSLHAGAGGFGAIIAFPPA